MSGFDWVEQATGDAGGSLCKRDGHDWSLQSKREQEEDVGGCPAPMDEDGNAAWPWPPLVVVSVFKCVRCGKVKRKRERKP